MCHVPCPHGHVTRAKSRLVTRTSHNINLSMWVEPEFVNRIECLKIYYIQLTIKDMLALSIGQDLPRKSAGVVEEVGVGDLL